jgi:ABC-type dipeptide/oligopeptide/nickel transport system permease component
MSGFLWRRLGTTVVMLFLLTLIVFMLAHMSGDPVALLAPREATREQREELRHALGLDRPLYVQFLDYGAHAIRGDLGVSLVYRQPALAIVLERMPATVELSTAAMLIALVVAVPAGVLAALRPGSWADTLTALVTVSGQSMPVYWIGIMAIILFAVTLGWLPAGGRDDWKSLILPAATLGLWPMARIARVLRASLLGVLREDYVRTARAKGLLERRVLGVHAFRNAAIPVLTITALTYGTILGGTVITESVFAWPGVGRLALEAVSNRDFPLLQATVLVVAVIFVAINFVLDLTYMWLDPRIRLR